MTRIPNMVAGSVSLGRPTNSLNKEDLEYLRKPRLQAVFFFFYNGRGENPNFR